MGGVRRMLSDSTASDAALVAPLAAAAASLVAASLPKPAAVEPTAARSAAAEPAAAEPTAARSTAAKPAAAEPTAAVAPRAAATCESRVRASTAYLCATAARLPTRAAHDHSPRRAEHVVVARRA